MGVFLAILLTCGDLSKFLGCCILFFLPSAHFVLQMGHDHTMSVLDKWHVLGPEFLGPRCLSIQTRARSVVVASSSESHRVILQRQFPICSLYLGLICTS